MILKILIALLCLIVLILIISVCMAGYFFKKIVVRNDNKDFSPNKSVGSRDKQQTLMREGQEWFLNNPKKEKITIESFDGLKLCGYYLPSDVESDSIIMAFNGYKSNSVKQYGAIAKYLNSIGYDLLLVDARSHGQSEGRYIGFGVLGRYDCQKWVNVINEKLGYKKNIFLYGVSMGSATVLMTSGLELPKEVKGIIADCGFTSPWDEFQYILKKDYHVFLSPILSISNHICKLVAHYKYNDASSLDAVKKSDIPLLVIHGKKDTFVPSYMGPQIYEASNSKYKKLLMVEDAYHGDSYYADTENYQKTMIDFINTAKYLD